MATVQKQSPSQAKSPDEVTEPEQQAKAESEAKAAPAAEKDVKYTGEAGVREITKAQWKAAGVEDQDTTIWNAENDYSLPASQFTDRALEVLKRDPNLNLK